jgi:hypothetical protein
MFLSLCLSFPLALSFLFFPCFSLCLSFPLALFILFYFCFSLSLSVSLFLCLSSPFSLCLSVISLFPFLLPHHCSYLFGPDKVSLSLHVCVCVCVRVCVCVYWCVSLTLSFVGQCKQTSF